MADDQWMFFPCEMGEHRAFIFFDHGVRDTISQAPNRLVKLRARFKNPSEAGLPTNAEYETLSGLENEIVNFVGAHKGWFVGRITVDGHRHFYCYVDIADDLVASFAAQAEQRFGHVLDFVSRNDPDKAGYLDELFPTDRDWQVMKDGKVIDALEAKGDWLSTERRIDHWAYFNDPSTRDIFVQWAEHEGFALAETLETEGDQLQYGAQIFHRAVPQLDTICYYTLKLLDKAKELGGDYDGWQTHVVTAQ